MLHSLKFSYRTIRKSPQFTILNLAGLSIGLACVFLIGLWIHDEKDTDRFHKNDQRLYQVMLNVKVVDKILTQPQTPGLLAPSFAKEMPEVEYAVSVQPGRGTGVITVNDKHIKVKHQYAGKDFFKVFSFELLEGNTDNVLMANNAVLLSHELAMKLFNTTTGLVGKTIYWGDETEPYSVSGIFKKPSSHSTLQFDLLFNYQLLLDKNKDNALNWHNSNPSTYLVMKDEIDINEFNAKIAGFIKSKSATTTTTPFVRKFSDAYLHDKYENGVLVGGRIEYVRLFSLIAVFILVIACVNFMNLSTARAAQRLKEVGIKKVVGASRGELIIQYLGESLFLSFMALLLAIAIVWLLLPAFNSITQKQLTIAPDMGMIVSILTVTFCTGLLAGSYPAFYLSGFKPVAVLKGKLKTAFAELWIRKGLVVFQFTISMIFIVFVMVVYKQMKLVQTIQLGYEKDNIISFRKEGKLRQNFQPFFSDILHEPGVVKVSSSSASLTGIKNGNTEHVDWQGKKADEMVLFWILDIDHEFMNVFDIKMKEGRRFSNVFGTDSAKLILNEAAVNAMGLKDAIGKTVSFWGTNYQVIGVTPDFHYESLYEKVKPVLIRYTPEGNNVFVKIAAANQQKTISRLAELYRQYNQGIPFEYSFVDEEYQAMYISEQRVEMLSKWFAFLAIFISCLGLFGLAAFTAQKRKKEIGIRKVIGASVGSIVNMLSGDLLKLVVISILIAFPLSWWLMNGWLNAFAYRVRIGGTVFIISGMSVVLISLLTISFQSLKAALGNPVDVLRSE
jgi:ABC-type antimicrobial peptide transport system permease subunit